MNFGDKVRRFMEVRKVGPKEAALLCGWTNRAKVSNLLSAKGNNSPATLSGLSRGFEVPPAYWNMSDPKDYLAAWLRWPPDGNREAESKRLPPGKRLTMLITELDRVWPNHGLLDQLRPHARQAVDHLLDGKDASRSDLEQIAEGLGLDLGFLDPMPLMIDEGERHQFDKIIALAKRSGIETQDLLLLVGAAGTSLIDGHAILDIVSAIHTMPRKS